MSESNAQPVEIFDVTIRDGSYVIDFQFTEEDNRFLCAALDKLGFPYIEVGHGLGLNACNVKRVSAATDEQYLTSAASTIIRAKFGAFFIPGIGEKRHLRWAREAFGMHFVRIGNDAANVEKILPYVEYAKSLGYEVMGNFMKSYTIPPAELARKSKLLQDAGCDAVYLVDSAGGMLPDQVASYVRAIGEYCDARIGFHGHNNLELAGANAIAAVQQGATLVDCSIGGLGRSAGNTRTELMIPLLRRMGYEVPHDVLQVIDVLHESIMPLLRNRRMTAEQIAGGYALVHSGLMQPFHENAARYELELAELLYEFGHTIDEYGQGQAVEDVATRLAARQHRTPAAKAEATSELLRVDERQTKPNLIHNTFVTVDQVLESAKVLARKANTPVVALVEFGHATTDEEYIMAEYLYHDEHFTVLRTLFDSAEQFVRFQESHRGQVDIVVFNDSSPQVLRQLRSQQDAWHHGERIVYSNLRTINYHYLMSSLHGLAMELDAKNILLVHSSPEDFLSHLPIELRRHNFFGTCTPSDDPQAIEFFRLDPALGQVHPPQGTPDRTFDVVVVASPITRQCMASILERLEASAVVVDCLPQHGTYRDLFAGTGRTLVPLDLNKALSGELLNLFARTAAA